MVYAKERIKEMPQDLIRYYEKAKNNICSLFSGVIFDDSSAEKHISFKLPISKKSDRLFVTFDPKPTEKYILVEIFIGINKLRDNKKLCYKPNRKDIEDKVSLLRLTPDVDFDYLFNLIEQSYNSVKEKSKVLK